MTEKPKYKISPSSINLFLECPRCFWLYLVKKEKRPSGPFPSLPSGMDKILKVHFDKFRDQGKLPPELKENGMVEEGYKLFDDKELLKDWQNNLRGIQHLDERSNILLRGAVDNILEKGQKLVVLDYKTRGYPLKEDTHEHYQMQMDLYTYLLKKNGYAVEEYAYLLFYYPEKVLEGGEVVFNTKLVKVETSDKRAEKIFKDTITLLNGECPQQTCAWCERVSL